MSTLGKQGWQRPTCRLLNHPQTHPVPPPHQQIQSLAPVNDVVTPYDREQFKLYLQLLDAEEQGVEWKTVARDIMKLDPEDASAKTCWQPHI